MSAEIPTTSLKPPRLKAIAGVVTAMGVVLVACGVVINPMLSLTDLQPWAFTHGLAWLLVVVLLQVIILPLTVISIVITIGEKAGDLVERLWKTKDADNV
jgi:hypothetical protein